MVKNNKVLEIINSLKIKYVLIKIDEKRSKRSTWVNAKIMLVLREASLNSTTNFDSTTNDTTIISNYLK